jgi:hypothetical protein
VDVYEVSGDWSRIGDGKWVYSGWIDRTEGHYKKCPFCGYEVVYDQMMIWETGYDELLRHPLHPLEGLGLPCPLSGLLFRKVKWETRADWLLPSNEDMLLGRIEKLEALLDEDRVVMPKETARAEHAETDAICLRHENEWLKSMVERLLEAGDAFTHTGGMLVVEEAIAEDKWRDLVTECKAKLEDR